MVQTRIITPRVAKGFVSRQTNLGVDSYDLNEPYSPDTDKWRSKVLDLGSPKYPPRVATSPARYWFDRSRYNNHGTIVGAIWKQLSSGIWVLSFDGDDKVTVTHQASLSLTTWSIECWFNPTDVIGDYVCIAKQDVNAETGINYRLYTTGTTLVGQCMIGGVYKNTTAAVMVAGSYQHLVATWTPGSQALYRNGVSVDTDTVAGNPDTTTGNVFIGKRDLVVAPLYAIGKIPLARIYNAVLTSTEVANHYQQERHLFGV